MQKIFKHIRQQPKHVRENYAFGIAATFTVIVLLVWVVSRPQTGLLGGIPNQVSETAAPFATLLKESKEQLAQLKNAAAPTTTALTVDTATATSGATALVLTQEDITIANAATTSISTTTAPKAYVEVLIGTSSAALQSAQNTAITAPEPVQ